MLKPFRHLRSALNQATWQTRNLADKILNAGEAKAINDVRRSFPALSQTQPQRLLVDISAVIRSNTLTGIQRVVRSIRDALPASVADGTAIDHLIYKGRRDGYVTLEGNTLPNGPGSLFLGLDFATDAVFRARHQLAQLRRSGTPMWFVIYDVLPLSNPDWFTEASQLKYRRWMRVCATLADGILCISEDSSKQVETLFRERYKRADMPQIVTITPGSDICASDTNTSLEQLALRVGLSTATLAQAVLIVGTIEPRKGHADALAAFERLWAAGHDIPLLLIGRPGWKTAKLQHNIRAHNKFGTLLFWCDDAGDDVLHAAYRHCRMSLVPSHAEGFGLPLDEALALGAPVLARDIAVFRRHESGQVRFFPTTASPDVLASAILDGLQNSQRSDVVPNLRRWCDTSDDLVRAIGMHSAGK